MKSANQSRGSSLIIILLFVVLLTGLAVVFLSRNQINTQSSKGSADGSQADVFCRGAVDTLIGDLKQEISAGSTIITQGTTKVYLPISAAGVPQNSLPYPVNGGSSSLTLVKESQSGQPFYAGNTYDTSDFPAANRASSSLTTTQSLNGRFVSLARWNKPLLLPVNSDTDFTPATSVGFNAPNWIYVARDGTNPTTYSSSMGDPTDSNTSFVIGRYAYAIYDESALLDMNAAGYPTGATPAQITTKGNLGLADLTQVGLLSSDIDALVGWRNYASAQPSGSFPSYSFSSLSDTNYFDFLLGMTSAGQLIPTPSSYTTSTWLGARGTGFLHPANESLFEGQSDRMFGSRQELIRMLVNSIAQSSSDRLRVETALQYLGTFSRELNSPSWMPVTPVGSTINYAAKALAQAQTPAASGSAPANQFASTVLVTKSFTRDDGTVANIGDPLMKYRFPLRRLEWFNSANQTAYATQLERWFSMKAHGDGTWDFVDIDNGNAVITGLPTIKTLDQVSALGREPTFWEMLQAAILSGSLGDGVAINSPYNTAADLNSTRHLLQIGLNIIDQYNTNSVPTVLTLGATAGTITTIPTQMPISGIKNLPYIYGLAQQGFVGSEISPFTYYMYWQFLFWNPHANASSAGTLHFRLRADGSNTLRYSYNNTGTSNWISTSALTYSDTLLPFHASGSRFATIDLLTPSDAAGESQPLSPLATYPLNSSAGSANQLELYVGQLNVGSIDGNTDPYTLPPGYSLGFTVSYSPYVSFRLEVQDPNNTSNWIPCQVIPQWAFEGTSTLAWNPGGRVISTFMNTTPQPDKMAFDCQIPFIKPDPRTLRFGGISNSVWESTLKPLGWTLPDTSLEGSGSTLSTFTPKSPIEPAGWVYNTTSSLQYYPSTNGTATSDNVVRKGDGSQSVGYANGGSPYNNAGTPGTTISAARPYFLGRSFNSVAEMGYAGRDEPWKTLNFYSADSADGGLLDYFSLSENSVRAGGINVNSASPQVLQAMLMGSNSDTNDPSSALTTAEAATIATAIRNYLGITRSAIPTNAPASNPADIARLTAQLASVSAIPSSTSLPGGLKRAQEVVARSLGDAWNTRTWNLMIDVVAQTGRFPKTGAATLDNFIVNGERRVWAHVAIDRYTGQVIDIQIEPVSE